MVPAIADRWGRRKSLVAVGGWSRFEVFKGRASQIDPARPQSDREDVVDQGVHPGGGRQAQLQGGLLAHHRRQGIHTSLSLSLLPQVPEQD
jgi:hypothetical protein